MTGGPSVAERVRWAFAATSIGSLLVALVAASFLLTPHQATPVAVVDPSARAAPVARGGFMRDATLDAAPADALTVVIAPPTAEPSASVEVAATPEPTPEPTPRPTPVPVRALPVVTTSTQDAEARMLALMNASRTAGGLGALAIDATVTATARAHSLVESQVGYVYHDGADGLASVRDSAACGTGWFGENTGKVWQGNVDRLHIEFMSEPWAPINHRTNIMDPSFRRVGVGAVQGPDALYMTMVFCR